MENSFETVALATMAGKKPDTGGHALRVRFWINQFGQVPAAAVTPAMVADGIDVLLKTNKLLLQRTREGLKYIDSGKPLAASTINRYVSTLGTVFKQARAMRLTPRGHISPTLHAERLTEAPGRTVSITTEQVMTLINACRLSRNRKLAAMVAVAVTTGLRRGSMLELTWGRTNLEQGWLDIPNTKNGTPLRSPLLPWVVKELKAIKPAAVPPEHPVFGQKSIKRALATAMKLADLPEDWTFHHLRHISASVLAQSGASTVQIMAVLNHKTPSMALRYSHLNASSQRAALAAAWA